MYNISSNISELRLHTFSGASFPSALSTFSISGCTVRGARLRTDNAAETFGLIEYQWMTGGVRLRCCIWCTTVLYHLRRVSPGIFIFFSIFFLFYFSLNTLLPLKLAPERAVLGRGTYLAIAIPADGKYLWWYLNNNSAFRLFIHNFFCINGVLSVLLVYFFLLKITETRERPCLFFRKLYVRKIVFVWYWIFHYDEEICFSPFSHNGYDHVWGQTMESTGACLITNTIDDAKLTNNLALIKM